MADYPHVQDPPGVDEHGRLWCVICRVEVFESVTDRAVICSEYCRGRHDERTGAPVRL
jgi:hypothetical protein